LLQKELISSQKSIASSSIYTKIPEMPCGHKKNTKPIDTIRKQVYCSFNMKQNHCSKMLQDRCLCVIKIKLGILSFNEISQQKRKKGSSRLAKNCFKTLLEGEEK